MSNASYVHHYNQRKLVFLTKFKPPKKAYAAGSNLKVSASLDTPKTLLYIDADTHTKGKREDVEKLFARLKIYLPSMPAPVVNERGGGDWLIIDTRISTGFHTTKSALPAPEYNALIEEFERRLGVLGADLDIEHIEAKGKVYEHHYNGKFMTHVKAGDLLKCPPSAEYVEQPALTVAQLKALVDALPSTASAPQTQPEATKTAEGTKKRSGSFRARLLTDKQVTRIDGLAAVIEKSLPDRPTCTAWRDAIPARRFAEVMIAICMLPANADESNPYRRHEEFIKQMAAEGVFKHRFRYAVYKAVRDYLTANNLTKWQDNTYDFDLHVSCKWAADSAIKQGVAEFLAGSVSRESIVTLITTKKKSVALILPECVTKITVIPFKRPLLILHSDLEPILHEWQQAA